MGSNIFHLRQLVQERKQIHQLFVRVIIEPARYRNAVVQLISKRLNRVVNDDCRGQVATEHTQVLQKISLNFNTRLAVLSMFDPFSMWVQNFEKLLCVHALRCCEHNHLEPLRHFC
eukprot:c10497_g1_i1.p2 GENE.c10497_g1_i1~~c10497_g1_i1.p2  ORF type:complete len:116 (+),score=10.92 c10497_g1_i1:137-484(+)